MSVFGVGTDIVSKQRIGEVLEQNRQRFIDRILTETELKEVPQDEAALISFISKRWAAKEAISKAFATGIGNQLSFQDLQIAHLDTGAPIVILSEKAQSLAAGKGFSSIMLSISDEKNYAVAFAIAV